MQLEELSNISDNLAMMPDPALQKFAQLHRQDPYMVSLALSESNRRKKMRMAAQGQAGAMPQPRVADAAIAGMAQTQLPENQGIARIPAPNMQAMADGGIAGYDDAGMATGGMGGMFNFAQQSEPVIRMSGGGAIGFASGGEGRTEILRAVLKELNEPFQNYLNNEKTRKAVDQLVQERLDKTATAAKPTAVTPTAASTAAPTKEGVLYKPAKLAGQAAKATSSALKGIPYVSGGIGAYQGISDLKDAGGFYNDPNVSTLDKAAQAGLTTLKAGLPIAGAGLGSFFTPAGTFVGGLAGTAASEYLDLETDALKAWKKANPQATPEQTKKAAVALAPAYDGPKINAAQAERATTGQPTVTPVPEPKPDSNVGGVKDLLPGSTFTPAKAPTTEDAAALGDKFFNSKSRIAEINRQVLQEQIDAGRAKENSIEALKAFNEKQGPAYAGYEQLLKKEELQDATDKEKAGLMSLMKGFLAMAAGESPNAATNIAKGAMVGMGDYGDALKEFKKAAKERNKEMQNIQQARRAEERGDFDKVQMYEDRANTANQASARFGIAAINDITNAGAKASTDIYNTISTNRSRENIAAMGERGANARASMQFNAPGATERLVDRMARDPKFAESYKNYASIGPEAKGYEADLQAYLKNPMILKATNPDLAAQFDAIIKQRMLKPTNSPTGQVLVGQ